jgi:hypothetical protein
MHLQRSFKKKKQQWEGAAAIIQRTFRHSISNPSKVMCKQRLKHEFYELCGGPTTPLPTRPSLVAAEDEVVEGVAAEDEVVEELFNNHKTVMTSG